LCNGWTWEEYVNACGEDSFRQSIDKMLDTNSTDFMERLEEKYFFAGACARWMFFLNTQQVIDEIETHISRIHSTSELLSGLQGNQSQMAVNHLITNYGKKKLL